MDKTEGTGQRVGGYRVVRKLATGGTSDVLLAKAEGPHGFERLVVLKLLLPEYTHDADVKGMFAREAAAYARLSHPSIVRLYDFFANDEQLVMVLEYIDGPPLSRLRGMLKAVSQQLDDATAIYVASSLFAGLAAAHGAMDDGGEPAPVIHRDVNPSNILVPWDGNVKLADFGVAKVTGASHQSSVGLIRGTFGYMAPEQVKGETVTPRADVYAGAIILWELLTKRRAFIRGALPEIEVLRELAEPRIVSIDVLRPDLDRSVRDAIKRALEPRGERRTITAEEMASILRSVVSEGEGRETLAKALALVRHEPRPSATSIPPPVTMTFGAPDQARYDARPAATTKPAFAPRATPPPVPVVKGVSRQTASYGATPIAPTGGPGSPRPPVVAAPRPAAKATEPPTVEAAPSSDRGLAALLEPSESDPRPNLGAGPTVPAFVPGAVTLAHRDSIDEILRSVPSNVPPNMFPKTDPPGGVPVRAPGAVSSIPGVDVLADPFAREIGQLPPAPPPLDPSVPLNLGATFVDVPPVEVKASTSSFPPLDRTLALTAPPLAMTAPMLGLEPIVGPPPDTARMAGFASAPAAGLPPPTRPPMAESAAAGTLPLGAMSGFAPAPHAATQLLAPGSYPPAHAVAISGPSSAPSALGNYAPGASPSASPAPVKRRSPAVALLALVVVVVVGGGLGAVAYLRRPRAYAIVGSAPTSSARAAAGAATEAATEESAAQQGSAPSAAASQAAVSTPPTVASASGSAMPAATAAPPAMASASASAAPSEPASDLPPGMGRVRTAGAAPGRRIFVDDRVAGQTPEAVVVKCGVRTIRVGSSGVARSVDVPCGGEITAGDR